MGRVGRDGDRVLVAARRNLDDVGGDFRLLDEALRGPAAQVYDARDARARRDLRHVENVLDDVELKIVLLLEARGGDADADGAIRDGRAEDGHA